VKILLVQSLLNRDRLPPVYPLGLSYIATFLNNHDTRIYDPNVSITHPVDDLIRELQNFRPDIVGISLRNIDNQSRIMPLNYYGDFLDLLHSIKLYHPSAIVVVGGTGFSMFAKEIMEINPGIDFGVYLEGEETFPELLDNLSEPEKVKGIYYRKNGTIYFTGLRPLPEFENYPVPRRDLIDMNLYKRGEAAIGIQTKRGCAMNCAYCNYPVLSGKTIRVRPPSGVVDEIEKLVNAYDVTQVFFADSVFNIPQEHAIQICEEIIKKKIKVGWMCYLDVRNVTRDFMLLLKKAGCNGIFFSPDGLSNQSLTSLRKDMQEKDVWNILKIIATEPEIKNMNFLITMFINTPGETHLGIFKMLLYKFMAIMIRVLFKRRVTVLTGWIRIEPDTETYRIAIEQGNISKDRSLLPKNRNDIKSLFYLKPSLKYIDYALLKLANLSNLLKGKF